MNISELDGKRKGTNPSLENSRLNTAPPDPWKSSYVATGATLREKETVVRNTLT